MLVSAAFGIVGLFLSETLFSLISWHRCLQPLWPFLPRILCRLFLLYKQLKVGLLKVQSYALFFFQSNLPPGEFSLSLSVNMQLTFKFLRLAQTSSQNYSPIYQTACSALSLIIPKALQSLYSKNKLSFLSKLGSLGWWGDEWNRWGKLRGTNFQLQNKWVTGMKCIAWGI